MTPEERQLLIDTHNKLEAFLQVYYRTNFPSEMVVTKNFTVQGNTNLKKVSSSELTVTDKTSFFGSTAQGQQPAIAKPTITGVASADIASLKVAVDKLIDTLKSFGFIA